MAIFKETDDEEMYLYMNGRLIYKRWFKTGASKVFDVMPYDKYTLMSITDMNKNTAGSIKNAKVDGDRE